MSLSFAMVNDQLQKFQAGHFTVDQLWANIDQNLARQEEVSDDSPFADDQPLTVRPEQLALCAGS